MTNIDSYKHLDDDPAYLIKIQFTMPELVKMVVAQNYGAHRFLSALVHELRAKSEAIHETPSELATVIEDALNRGLYY
jgi:hypothetical protein